MSGAPMNAASTRRAGPDPIPADERVVAEVLAELRRAREKHPTPMHSSHEGYAVLLEEVDELRDEVKAQTYERSYSAIRREAIQVAAMAVRIILDVCEPRIPGGAP